MKVKLTVLNDNTSGRRLLAEHGLSFLIETEEKKILFDTGATDVFLRNAASLKIDLNDVDAVVLSHGHWDHGNGLKFINNLKLVAHPDVFKKRYHLDRKKDYVGLDMDKHEVESKFDLTLSKDPLWLADDIVFLGEIPRINDFEAKTTSFVDEEGKPDFITDDSGIAIRTKKGLIVISGCAHAGICNTVSHAANMLNEDKIYAVMGGFHLKRNDSIARKTVAFFKQNDVKYVYPSHCTDLPALSLFYDEFGMQRIKSGDVICF